MRRWLFLAFAALSASAQTTVYLRDYGIGFYFNSRGGAPASNTTPIVMRSATPHGLAAGDTVGLWNIPFDKGSGCGSGGMVNGRYKVKEAIDGYQFSITDLNGADVAAKGVWCDGSIPGHSNGGPQWGGKIAPYTLVSGMKGWFDGDNGEFTRQVALGTWNGLTSVVVSGGIATVTTSFPQYVESGWKIGVWGSDNSALNNGGNPYVVTVDSETQFHFPVSNVSPGTYTGSNMKCGPSGASDCLRLSVMAWTGNPWWDNVVAATAFYNPGRSTLDGGTDINKYSCGGCVLWPSTVAGSALKFFVDQTDTASRDLALYMFDKFERINGNTFAADETLTDAGPGETYADSSAWAFRDAALVYSVMRDYRSAAQRKAFLNKVFADITDDQPCTKNLFLSSAAGETIDFDGARTLTGHGTRWMTNSDTSRRVQVGDVFRIPIIDSNNDYTVTAVNSDTSLTVIATTSSPLNGQAFKYARGWQDGQCGAWWLKNHWLGAMTHPALYGASGGELMNSPSDGVHGQNPGTSGNNNYTHLNGILAMALAAADDDPRAIRELEKHESFFWDYFLPYSLGYTTGYQNTGAYYSPGRNLADGPQAVTWLFNSVKSFPDLDLAGPWIRNVPLQKVYGTLPNNFTGWQWPVRYGAETGDNRMRSRGCGGEFSDPVSRFAPKSSEASVWRNWLEANGFATAAGLPYRPCAHQIFLFSGNPNAVASYNYRALPKQRLFQTTSQDRANALGLRTHLSSGPYPAAMRGDAVISRTGWSSIADTHVQFQARTFTGQGHDVPQGGSLQIYKLADLIGDGHLPSNAPGSNSDMTALGSILDFGGGARSLHEGFQHSTGKDAVSYIDRWSGDGATGDPNSRYVYARADVAGMYTKTIRRAKVHFAHFKPANGEEIVLQYFDVDVSGAPTTVRGQIHYPQNGEAAGFSWPAEGATQYPGAGGCAGLNSDRLILSQENGSAPYTAGVITRIFSPSTITVRCDGSSYSGSQGHDERVSICAGSSCQATVSSTDFLILHKVTATMSDTRFDAAALNPDGRWTGAQTAGAVVLFSRGDSLQLVARFQTTHAGVAQYLIAGLEGGHTYRAYRHEDGVDVAIQPVRDNDNTFYFEATAGTYSVFPVGLSNLILRPGLPIHKRVRVDYDFKVAGDPDVFAWTVSAGQLPPGLTFTNGVLAGAATKEGVSDVTIRATNAASGVFAEMPLQLTVTAPPLNITIQRGKQAAILGYGAYGLDALAGCVVNVSTAADFSSTVETFTDTGGPARRTAVIGRSSPLAPGTKYYVKAQCGELQATAAFATLSDSGAASGLVPVMFGVPARLGAASAEVHYGSSPQLGGAVAASCSGVCRASVPGGADEVVYIQRVYRDSSARVIAYSSVTPAIAYGEAK